MKKLFLLAVATSIILATTSCRKAECQRNLIVAHDSWEKDITDSWSFVLMYQSNPAYNSDVEYVKEVIYNRTKKYLVELKEMETQKGCARVEINGQSLSAEIYVIDERARRMFYGDFGF
jgi:hypothetical protein